MSVEVVRLNEEEPPSSRAQAVVQKACQLLLYFFCLAPIALFPVGLAYKIFQYFFP
jgi:hypothetical protein